MTEIDAYVGAVLSRIPQASPARERIERDLREHLRESVAAGSTAAEAIGRMGAPSDVAAEFLAAVGLDYAPLSRRIGAYLVDIGLGIAVSFGFFLTGGVLADVPMSLLLTVAAVSALLSILYFPVLEAVWGQTAGKWLFGIVVVRESGERAGLGAAVIRRLSLFFQFFVLDALFAFFTQKRQRAMDIVARTVVIRGNGHPAVGWTVAVLLYMVPVATVLRLP